MISVRHCGFEIQESFSLGKYNDLAGGGDRLIRGIRFVGVVDAATEKFGNTWTYEGEQMSGERVIATLLERHLSQRSDELLSILCDVQRELRGIGLASGINLAQAGASPQASFLLFDAQAKVLYQLGDCNYGIVTGKGFHAVSQERLVDRLGASKRAQVLRAFLAEGEGVLSSDPGRAAILEELREAVTLANADPLRFSPHDTLYGVPKMDLVYSVFDMNSKPNLTAVAIPREARAIVLSSDGYPKLFSTLQESEAYLQRSLAEDPMRIKDHPSTKGVAPGAVSYDDRSYVKLVLS
jgi:hypothetical protein